jgi:hypothetical protein
VVVLGEDILIEPDRAAAVVGAGGVTALVLVKMAVAGVVIELI